ncbi:circularly permuted type 2 ATP-grasp protein, partial [Francisella tularensis subsp. holarctica]
MSWINPPHGVYCHSAGLDLIKDESGFIVLEDNVRTPSGVSYVIETRNSFIKAIQEAFANTNIKQVVDYPTELI